MILNYAKKEFYFLPNSHYQDRFDYAYSGVELYMIDGKIILGDVAAGSPAESVGLKEGDEVISINNILGQNLQLFKSALQAQGEKIRMIVNREGELMEFHFKIKSIL
jgi:predicted metalloprotease with PDZ domain